MNNIGYIVIGLLVTIGLILILYYNYFLKVGKEDMISLLVGPTKFIYDFEKELYIENLLKSRDTFYIPGKQYGLTLKFEMYIPNIPGSHQWRTSFSNLKPIVNFDDIISINYQPKNGYLLFRFKYSDNPFMAHYPEIKVDNVKLQKWNTIVLVIHDRNISIYNNYEIVKTKTLPNIPNLDFYKINIGKINNNFMGTIKNMDLYPYPIKFKDFKKL